MPDLKDQLQRTLGSNYTLERELGGGGMSRVFVAEELSLERKVVVKVLPPELAATVNVERFRREIQLAAKLQHPHIVPVLAAGISEGLPYYTMPFIEGVSLRTRLARSGELPVQEAAKILGDVLSALSYAHAHGVVHRDIKPDNVLLTDHHAVVTDFGVAKALSASTNPGSSLTSLGVALGTPAYMSPEQAAADPNADQRTDIYSVGAMAYEMLTGHQIFSARSPQAMLAAHATEKPEPIDKRRPSVPKALSSLVMRALEKHAADRPQSAGEMLADLEAAVTPSGATPPTGIIPAMGRRGWRNLAVIGGAVVVAALLVLFLGRGRIESRLDGRSNEAAGSDGPISTIAVLPFANTGGNRQDEYFSDGMTEELARALSMMPRIHVASRTSSYAFKGKSVTAQDIGKTLHVTGVVEGTVRRAGNRLRVTAQLTNASTGLVMWTDGFERPASNVFEVQDELTKAIVAALTSKLSGDTAALVAAESRGTADPLAYDLYLRGRFEWNKRTGKDIKEGIADFERAVARDPKFARAYAALASSYAVLPQYAADEFPLEKSLAAVRSNVDKALAIDSTLAEPHAVLGSALEETWRWAESEREFRKAITLDPSYPTAHQWYAILLNDLGRLDDALSENRIARKLDPLSLVIASNLCGQETRLGHFDLAAMPCKESSAMHDGSAFNYMVRGKYDSAAIEWRRAGNQLSFPGMLAYSLARGGHRSEAEALLKDLEKKGDKDPLSVAIAYFGLDESDKAFAFLERSVDLNQEGLKDYMAPLSSVILAPYRGDPRLQRSVDRMGLTQYAKDAWAKK